MTDNDELVIPALRAKMGDNIYYISFLRMKEIADRVGFAEDFHYGNKLGELIQRRVTHRSTEISSYLETQPQRFFNALIIGSYGGAPKWYELSIQKSELFDPGELPSYKEGALGILKFDGSEKLFAIDGQHRVAGIKGALSTGGNIGLEDEEVCTIFVAADVTKPAGKERERRLFSTLNRYAKPVDMMDIIALDEDDAVAIVTRRLMEEYPLFMEHRISVQKGKAVAVTDKTCFTNITTLYEVNDIILSSERGRKWNDFKRFRPSDERLYGLYANATEFWNLMVQHFHSLSEVLNSTSTEGVAGRYRNRNGGHILFRTVGLLSMAKAIKRGIELGGTLSSWILKLAETPTEVASEPWVGLLWDPAQSTMIVRKENQNIATLLLLYMAGVDLASLRTSERRLRERYAGALNRSVTEVTLPKKMEG